MNDERTFMRIETGEAAATVSTLLDREAETFARIAALFADRQPGIVTTAARGSSDHAASFFKYLFEITTGRPVASIGPSVASVYATPLRLAGGVHFTISQSGASPDIVALQRAAAKGGAATVAVVNVLDSPLAREADIVLGLHAGPENSVAATKSCIAAAAALAGVTAAVAGDADLKTALARLPGALSGSLAEPDGQIVERLAATKSLYVSGRGTGFAVSLEAALKAKETCGIHAEAFSLAELMHGPMRLVETGFPVLAFLTDDRARPENDAALARLAQIGGDIVRIGADNAGPCEIRSASTGHGLLDPLAGLAAYYGLIERVALRLGHDPDRPRNLKKVTETV